MAPRASQPLARPLDQRYDTATPKGGHKTMSLIIAAVVIIGVIAAIILLMNPGAIPGPGGSGTSGSSSANFITCDVTENVNLGGFGSTTRRSTWKIDISGKRYRVDWTDNSGQSSGIYTGGKLYQKVTEDFWGDMSGRNQSGLGYTAIASIFGCYFLKGTYNDVEASLFTSSPSALEGIFKSCGTGGTTSSASCRSVQSIPASEFTLTERTLAYAREQEEEKNRPPTPEELEFKEKLDLCRAVKCHKDEDCTQQSDCVAAGQANPDPALDSRDRFLPCIHTIDCQRSKRSFRY